MEKFFKFIKQYLKGVQLLFAITCLGFVLYHFYLSKDKLLIIAKHCSLQFFIASIILWCFVIISTPFISFLIIRAQFKFIPYKNLLSIYANRIPAKYLPGGVWQTVARGYDLYKFGLGKKELTILIFYENFWSVLLAGLIGGIGNAIYNEGDLRKLGLLVSISILCGLTLFFIFIPKRYRFTFKNYCLLTCVSTVTWAFSSCSFYIYLISLGVVDSDGGVIKLASNYIFSWFLGFISFFTPQGIGVFETSMVHFDIITIGGGEAFVIFAGFRFVLLIGDVLIYLFLKIGGETIKPLDLSPK